MNLRSLLIVVFASLVFTGCIGGSVTIPLSGPILQHLYVGNDNPGAQINQYTLPITSATQAANFTITAPGNVFGLGLDAAGNLGVAVLSGPLAYYNAPLSGASAPAATFNNGATGGGTQLAFTPAGDFWVGSSGNRVNMFTHPFSNASTPSSFVTNPALNFSIGVMLDAAQNLYVVNGGSGTGGNVFVYAPPYSGAPVITAIVAGTNYRKSALSATQLFATSVTPNPVGRVDVYNLPITAASVPAFSITNSINIPEAAALDAAGNLYVGNLGNHTITVYAPPFSAASAPTVTLTVGGAGFAIFAIAIGN